MFSCDNSYSCQIACDFAPNSGYSNFADLSRYCCHGNPDTCADCLQYYLSQMDSRCSLSNANADTVFVGGNMDLTPAAVDSVMAAFTQGFQGGMLTFIPFVGGAIAVVIVMHLLSYAVSKS